MKGSFQHSSLLVSNIHGVLEVKWTKYQVNLRSYFVILQYDGSNWANTLKNIFRRLDFSWLFGKWIEGPLLDFKPKGDGFLLLSIVSKSLRKFMDDSSRMNFLPRENWEYLGGGASLTFQSNQLPWLPTIHSRGLLPEVEFCKGSVLTHGLCRTAHVETWCFPFPPSLALYITLMFISLGFLFSTDPSLGVSIWNLSFSFCRSFLALQS